MSLPLAIILALTPPTPTPPILPPPAMLRPAPRSCADIDPHFARFVTPPVGTGPIWPIEQVAPGRPGPPFDVRDLDFGPAVKGWAAKAPPLACPRLTPAGDRG